MALLTLADAELAYGLHPLLDGASFSLERGERVGLIGRNGTGKSSLLGVLEGTVALDGGVRTTVTDLSIRRVAQEPVLDPGATVFEAVAAGVAEAKALRTRYEEEAGDAHADAAAWDRLQARIEALGAWTWEQRVAAAVQRLGLDPDARVGSLSGGTKKRVALAQALVAVPDVLLLDEPTNHLDVDAIDWLAGLLAEDVARAVVVVTHDRAFLDAVATRIVELDRGTLRSYPGRFAEFEVRKADELAAEALAAARADKLLAQEEVWVRQGVEARRTRSVSRVARLEALRAARAARREALGKVRLSVDPGERSGRIVAELVDVSKGFPGKPIVEGFSATVLRGDKVGILGPNGAGKTTLLRLLLGELAPDAGTVRRGTKLEVAYFDQMRSALDLSQPVARAVSPSSDWIETPKGRRHIVAWLGDFLFPPERAATPLSALSGGERSRVLLARLFAQPANVLVLDEPTNDLDIETLELLEELLQGYAGTVFVVSHDRRFLDHVATSTIAWAGDEAPGLWREHEGGYSDWKLQRARTAALRASAPVAAPVPPAPAPPAAAPAPAPAPKDAPVRRKLAYKEQRELEALPARIAALEAEQRDLNAKLASADFYAEVGGAEFETATRRAAAIDDELLACLERWEALEALAR